MRMSKETTECWNRSWGPPHLVMSGLATAAALISALSTPQRLGVAAGDDTSILANLPASVAEPPVHLGPKPLTAPLQLPLTQPTPPIPTGIVPSPLATNTDGERVTIKQAANIRSAANNTATVVRIAPQGAVVRVFAKSAGWLQVGTSEPWGWIFSGLVEGSQ